MQEIWKDIKGYEGLYQVSNMGRVKNKKNCTINPELNKNGYNICLYTKKTRGEGNFYTE